MKILLCLLLLTPLLGRGQARPDDFIYIRHLGAQEREIPDRCLTRGEYVMEPSGMPDQPADYYVVGDDLTPLLAYLVRRQHHHRTLTREEENGTFAFRYQRDGTAQVLYLHRRPFKAFVRYTIRVSKRLHGADTPVVFQLLEGLLEDFTRPTKKERRMFSL